MFYLSGFADEIHESIDEQIRVLNELNIHSIEVRGVNGRNISTLSLEELQKMNFSQLLEYLNDILIES